MPKRRKILLLDDDQDVLDLYREILMALPSEPEVHTATSGARALALLESEPFSVLISDLRMPKMDGLQVLSIVRKRHPELRTVVMSALHDDGFKDRAYAMGIDQFLEKPRTSKEINYFCECVDGLLNKEESGGFRGVQSKSLMDIVQFECLSQSTSVLKITNGPVEGRIWITQGEVYDAAAADLSGEAAFRVIAGWKGGSFEVLPGETARARAIHSSYQGLLLDTAQALDEAQAVAAGPAGGSTPAAEASRDAAAVVNKLSDMARLPGVEFVVAVGGGKPEAWGLENPEQIADWTRYCMSTFRELGDQLQWGQLKSCEGYGLHGNVGIITQEGTELCAGFERSVTAAQIQEAMKKIQTRWIS